eukprot:CAMPEP_0198644158 /NCGR_PEP_ID=MMETSP1467-20131203/438_1 /TAXON_ID=1462469 /ORGANISM="unid. sp., Strain CCMP2135" /LENGTH=358 /DNA_ID=CAMNT_0044379605 /DNA_START=6 /DNA_END=1080 /DNA_ORIENTATION=+
MSEREPAVRRDARPPFWGKEEDKEYDYDDGRRRRRRQNNNNNSAGRRKKEKEPRRTKRNPEEEEGPPFFFFFFLVSVEDFGARGATATTTTAGTACTGAAGHGECSFELFDGHGLHVDVAGARERGVEEPFAAAAAGAAAAGRAEAECGGVLPGYDGIRVYDDDFARGEVLLQDGAHRRQEGRASADDRLMNAALPGAAAPQAVAVYVERHAHVADDAKKAPFLARSLPPCSVRWTGTILPGTFDVSATYAPGSRPRNVVRMHDSPEQQRPQQSSQFTDILTDGCMKFIAPGSDVTTSSSSFTVSTCMSSPRISYLDGSASATNVVNPPTTSTTSACGGGSFCILLAAALSRAAAAAA